MKFRKFAATSQGTKYSAKGWACQDFSGALDFGNVQIIAVADGHGGSQRQHAENRKCPANSRRNVKRHARRGLVKIFEEV